MALRGVALQWSAAKRVHLQKLLILLAQAVSTTYIALQELRHAGVIVDVLKDSVSSADPIRLEEIWQECLDVNEVNVM